MFNCPLDNLQTETKGTVLLKSAEELKDFTKGEENMLKNSIEAIQKSGAQVLVCGGKISDLGLDYANQNGLMVVRLTSKWDMRRLAKSIGATVLPRLSPPTPDEMGFCEDVKGKIMGPPTLGYDSIASVKPFKSKNRDKIYLDAPNLKKVLIEIFERQHNQ